MKKVKLYVYNKLYIDFEDIFAEEVPAFVQKELEEPYFVADYLEIENPEVIKYYEGKDYIEDIRDLCAEKEEVLREKLSKAQSDLEKEIARYANSFLNTGKGDIEALRRKKRKYENLDEYVNHRNEVSERIDKIYIYHENVDVLRRIMHLN